MAMPFIRQHVTCSELPWYMPLIYTFPTIMAKTKVAKLFRNGRSQAVRLPKEFRFEGDCVRVRKVPGGVLLEPVISDVRKWFAELDLLNTEPLLPGGRNQPKAPRRRYFR
jgi:antitoxin VapB